jgi:hypothetical protein
MTTAENRLDRIESLLERHIIQAERDGEAPAAGIAKRSKPLSLRLINALK